MICITYYGIKAQHYRSYLKNNFQLQLYDFKRFNFFKRAFRTKLKIQFTLALYFLIILFYLQMEAVYEYQSNSTNNQFYATTNPMYRTKLWNDSQITINNVSPFLSFSKEKRFKWSSIYWPDSSEKSGRTNNKGKSDIHQAAKKISKMIDDEQKDQERMRMVKRTLSLGKSQLNSARKEVHNVLSTKKPFQLSKQTERIVNRLAPVMIKRQSLLRDRHGNRCNLFSNPEEEEEKQGAQYFAESTGFKTSRKIKLQLPHNYFPGPGTYEIKRYLADLDIKSACISLKSSDKQQLKKEQS